MTARAIKSSLAMHPVARELCGGQAKVRSILEKQRMVKDGRLEKKSPASKVAQSHVSSTDSVVKKKSVNGYMIFRCWFAHYNVPVLPVHSQSISNHAARLHSLSPIRSKPIHSRNVGERVPQAYLDLDRKGLDSHPRPQWGIQIHLAIRRCRYRRDWFDSA